MLSLVARGGPLMDVLIPAVGGDRDEFLAAAYALDLGSWKTLTATFDGRRLNAVLDLDPNGRLAGVLEGRAGRQPWRKPFPRRHLRPSASGSKTHRSSPAPSASSWPRSLPSSATA